MSKLRAYLELHLAVLLYGLTAILGEVLSLSALPLVWWRVGIASISFLPVLWWVRKRKAQTEGNKLIISNSTWLAVAGIGCIIALHWLTFYGSIKLANASVALVCFATTALLTSLIEPYVLRKAIDWFDVGLGALVIPGMVLIIGVIDAQYYLGIAVGLLSALLAAVFSSLNKRYVQVIGPVNLSAVQMLSAFIFLSVAWPILQHIDMGVFSFWPSSADWKYLLILALGCTTLAYVLNMRSLQFVSAFSSTLAISLEPVYGIILAALFLGQHEVLKPEFYWGAVLLFSAVLLHPFIKYQRKRRSNKKLLKL